MVALKLFFSFQQKELLNFPVRCVYFVAALLPISALLLVFALGSILHPTLLYEYEWACGKARLPSVSRIINMPLERIVFQIFILFDVPFRLFSLWFQAQLVNKKKGDFLLKSLRYAMIISSLIEIITLSFLATVGEHESGNLHVVFFCVFTLSSFAYFLSHSCCLRLASNGTEIYENGFQGRVGSVVTLALTVPLIFTFFTLYNGFCVPYTYELFAIFEYITVSAMCFYHVTSYYQLQGHVFIVYSRVGLEK